MASLGKFLVISTIISIPFLGLAQKKIIGKVVDSKNKQPVPFAHIYIKNTSNGVITNDAGDFVFNIQNVTSSDSLVISSIGYKSHTFSHNSLHDQDTFFLNPESVYLKTVTVSSPPNQASIDSAALLFVKSRKNIKRNYPSSSHLYELFYRETSSDRHHYLHILEASALIQGFKASSNPERTRIDIHQLRKSDDHRRTSGWKTVMKMFFGEENELYQLYNDNPIFNYARNHGLFTDHAKGLENFVFYLKGHTYQDGVKIYIINYHTPYNIVFPYYEGTLWIRADDYAIVKTEKGQKQNPKLKKGPPYDETYYPKAVYEFQKINGSYYLKYAYAHKIQFLDLEKVNDNVQLQEYEYNERILLVNNVITDKKQFDRIKRRGRYANDLLFEEYKFPYDKSFWSNYNMVLKNPLMSQAVEDLSKERDLEEQFKDNSKKVQ